MRIGIDISQVVYEGTGVSRFTRGLIHTICAYDKKNEWVFFYSGLRRSLQTDIQLTIEKKGYKLVRHRIPPKILAGVWIKIGFTVESIDKNLDWFITSDWAEIPSSHTKKATIVHDLTFLRYPELVEKNVQNVQTDRLNRVKKQSSLIFSDSFATKDDIVKFLGIDNKKIIVNYPGVKVRKPTNVHIKEVLKKYGLVNKQFILTVGKLEPRKNIVRLLQSFNQLKHQVQLVIVGQKGWSFDVPSTSLKASVQDNIRFIGLMPDEELYSLYSSCLFFIFPSLWEGFGYPIIEAMQLGAPVACSNTSSIKEIAGDSALLFNPLDIEEMYRSIDRLIQDETLQKELAKKGLQRGKMFTWKNYYNRFIKEL